jgi:hypothetical protein
VSPGSAVPSQTPSNLSNSRPPIPSSIAPWENPPPRNTSGFGNHRKDLAVLESAGSGRVPAINRQPPSALTPNPLPWGNGNIQMPSSVFGSFYDDSSEEIGGLSPGFRPGSSQEDMGFPGEDRRPSIASATTVSSIGSKSSASRGLRNHRKLHGFFGEEFPGLDEASRQNSESSLPPSAMYAPKGPSDQSAAQRARNRNNSLNTANNIGISRPESPASFSRPRTPRSSEVTPWEFQDFTNKVRCFPQISCAHFQYVSCAVPSMPEASQLLPLLPWTCLSNYGNRNCRRHPIKMLQMLQEFPKVTTHTSCIYLAIDTREAKRSQKPASWPKGFHRALLLAGKAQRIRHGAMTSLLHSPLL